MKKSKWCAKQPAGHPLSCLKTCRCILCIYPAHICIFARDYGSLWLYVWYVLSININDSMQNELIPQLTEQQTVIEQILAHRRSVPRAQMNGTKIPDDTVRWLLSMADWAPTHKRTEPWYFVVFSGDKVQQFGHDHAELYKKHTPEEKFAQPAYEKLADCSTSSHIIAICMKRHSDKLPEFEEVAAVSCAVQNMWIAATALGIAGFWQTGGMTLHPSMKEYLELEGEEDRVLGLFYLGYTDESPLKEGKRNLPMEAKVRWA